MDGWTVLNGSSDKNKIINISTIYDVTFYWPFVYFGSLLKNRQKILIGLLDV